MFKINDNYLRLPGSYLFSTIGKKVNAYAAANPDKKIIRLGIGDVTQPLVPAIITALHGAVDEMGAAETFMPLRKTITRQEDATFRQTKSLCPTGQSAIPGISRKFSVRTIRLQCATLCILFMWTPM